jgi:UDP-GlcNAc3NAcA epimerase
MKKIMTIVGARPQFIKLAPLAKLLDPISEHTIIHTGQHFDDNMSQVFFEQMNIREPDINLAISGGNHGKQTGQMLIEIEKVILDKDPSLVIVFGDTNSTLAGALAASKLHVPVLHIEAGLRSFDMKMPEEQNRICVDHISTFLAVPSETAKLNLNKEGINKNIVVTGDIMLDSLAMVSSINSEIDNIKEIKKKYNGHYAVLTLHRASNTDDKKLLINIINMIESMSLPVIFPVHPRTKNKFKEFGITPAYPIQCIDPLSYFEMVELMKGSTCILTDSGGLQKEAYFLKKPCITIRDTTEWTETVENGCNTLVLSSKDTLDSTAFNSAVKADSSSLHFPPVYGEENVSQRIVDLIFDVI